jgi:hypothetical protein
MNIKELAEQAGLDWHRGWTLDDNEPNRFTVFAMLVAAHEREECAKLFDNHNIWDEECANAIRERGKA